jgi:hypothetical protein
MADSRRTEASRKSAARERRWTRRQYDRSECEEEEEAAAAADQWKKVRAFLATGSGEAWGCLERERRTASTWPWDTAPAGKAAESASHVARGWCAR